MTVATNKLLAGYILFVIPTSECFNHIFNHIVVFMSELRASYVDWSTHDIFNESILFFISLPVCVLIKVG